MLLLKLLFLLLYILIIVFCYISLLAYVLVEGEGLGQEEPLQVVDNHRGNLRVKVVLSDLANCRACRKLIHRV